MAMACQVALTTASLPRRHSHPCTHTHTHTHSRTHTKMQLKFLGCNQHCTGLRLLLLLLLLRPSMLTMDLVQGMAGRGATWWRRREQGQQQPQKQAEAVAVAVAALVEPARQGLYLQLWPRGFEPEAF